MNCLRPILHKVLLSRKQQNSKLIISSEENILRKKSKWQFETSKTKKSAHKIVAEAAMTITNEKITFT